MHEKIYLFQIKGGKIEDKDGTVLAVKAHDEDSAYKIAEMQAKMQYGQNIKLTLYGHQG